MPSRPAHELPVLYPRGGLGVDAHRHARRILAYAVFQAQRDLAGSRPACSSRTRSPQQYAMNQDRHRQRLTIDQALAECEQGIHGRETTPFLPDVAELTGGDGLEATSSSCSITPASRRKTAVALCKRRGGAWRRAFAVSALMGLGLTIEEIRLAPAYRHRRRRGTVSRRLRHRTRQRGARHRHPP